MTILRNATLNLIFIVLFIHLSFEKLYSQNIGLADISTPRGSQLKNTYFIYDQDFDSARIAADSIYFTTNYSVTIIAPSSKKYNCHAYAWHVSEGGNYAWIGYYPHEGDESIYWTDGSYEAVSEANATKVSYAYAGEHSAIRTETPGYYISKWADGPLIYHHKDNIPTGYGTPTAFYIRALDVYSGSDLISALSEAVSNCRIVHILGSANFIVSSSVTVPSCVTLKIYPGANVTFAAGITVNGNLETEGATINFGSSTSLIVNGSATCSGTTFGSSGWWDGIFVNGTADLSGCYLFNSYANTINGGSIIVSRTTFSPVFAGLNFLNSSSGGIYSNNVFCGYDYDIYCDQTSYINAGDASNPGYNSFRGPFTHWYVSYPGTIYAQHNYWRGSPPTYPDIVTNPTLPNDPNLSKSPGDEYKSEIESGIFLQKTVVKNDEPVVEKVPGIEELDEAMMLLYGEKYDEALVEMHRLVDKYSDGFVGKRALVFIEEILRKSERREEILPMLNSYSVGKSKVAEFAHYRKSYQYRCSNEIDQAIAIMKATEFSEENADLRQVRLADLGIIYHDYLDNKAEATIYFNELVKTYPESQLTKAIKRFYNVTGADYEKPETDKEIIAPTETKLFANYPNPFNPTTVIKYQLSEASLVSLKVYDVMGREVTTLVNSFQDKGSYDVTFNARGLSSGIYFYKLNTNGKQLINKMLLMK